MRDRPPDTLLVSQLAHFKFPIPFLDSLNLSYVSEFSVGHSFFNGPQVQNTELIISPVHNILLSLVQESPIYLFICLFIHLFAMYVLFY